MSAGPAAPPIPRAVRPSLLFWSALASVGIFLGQCACAQLGILDRLGSFLLAGAAALLLVTGLGRLAWNRAGGEPVGSGSKPASFGVPLTAAAGLLVAFCALFPSGGEHLLGGNDQGIYVNGAVTLARSGRYGFTAPLLKSAPEELRPWLLAYEPAEAQRRASPAPRHWNYHTGLFLHAQPPPPPPGAGKPPIAPTPASAMAAAAGTLSADGRVDPQFPPGFPVLLASAYQAAGWPGLAWVNAVCVALGALFTGLLLRRWLDDSAAAALGGLALGLFFPLEVWISRSHFAEPLVALLWLVFLWAWSERDAGGIEPRPAGALAGLALGAALYVKVDALLIGTLGAGAVLFSRSTPRAFKTAFFAAGLLAAGAALSAWWQFSRLNLMGSLSALLSSSRTGLLAAGAGLLAAGVLARFGRGWLRAAGVPPLALPALVAATVVLGAAYAYFLRPNPAAPDRFFFWPANGLIRSYREDTFLRLGWYWRPWGLAAATLGAALLAFRLPRPWQKALWSVGVFSLAALCYDLRNNPLQPYAMRRLVPAALLPLFCGAVALFHAAGQGLGVVAPRWVQAERWPRLARRVIPLLAPAATLALTATLLMGFAPMDARFSAGREYAGLGEQLAALAARVPRDGVVLVRRRDPLAGAATPLQFVEGVDSLLLNPIVNSRAYEGALGRALARWQGEGRRVFVLASRPGDRLDLFGLQTRPAASGELRFRYFPQLVDRLADTSVEQRWPFVLEEIVSLPTPPTLPPPLTPALPGAGGGAATAAPPPR